MTAVDEAQAAEFRRQQSARASWMAFRRLGAFPSDPAYLATFWAAWQPLLDASKGWDAPELAEGDKGMQVP